MRRLALSATYSNVSPLPSARPYGLLKRAFVPTPSGQLLPEQLSAPLYTPATVVTCRVATSILRIRSTISLTYTDAPSGVTAMPSGLEKRAASPTPSSEPELLPQPASVVTTLVATTTLRTT